ncbi:MAG: BMP family lipoprotein [Saccharofermentanales bacterium]
MKKVISILLIITVIIALFTGCGNDKSSEQDKTEKKTEEPKEKSDASKTDEAKEEVKKEEVEKEEVEKKETKKEEPAEKEETKKEEPATKDYKIAMVAAGVFGDQGMNDALLNGMNIFTENTGILVDSVEISDFSDHAINARNFAQQGYDVVLMGGPVSEIMPEIAAEFPDTHFILNKGTITDMDNVTSVQFNEAGGGFLSGAFAVIMSKELGVEPKVGWVGGERIPDLEKARYAFSAAVEYMGGECDVVYVGSFTDIAKGKEIAMQMYNDGATFVQAYAGGASNGVYQAVESVEGEKYALGCATGQFHLSPDKILASSVVMYDQYFSNMLEEYVETGKIDSGLQIANIETGGTGLLYSPEIGDMIPDSVKTQIEDLKNQIIDGTLVVPTNEEQYNELIKD